MFGKKNKEEKGKIIEDIFKEIDNIYELLDKVPKELPNVTDLELRIKQMESVVYQEIKDIEGKTTGFNNQRIHPMMRRRLRQRYR